MKIEIQADKNKVLGGPELIPYLKLELREDGSAILCTGIATLVTTWHQ